MLDHPNQNPVSICRKLSRLFIYKKWTPSFTFFLRHCKNSKVATLGNLGTTGHTHLKWQYQFEEIFDVYLQAKKSNFIYHVFLEILQISYFGYFEHAWACFGYISMFIYMPKINFIAHFFLQILHFKEFCNLIGRQHFCPELKNQNFARYSYTKIAITVL